MAKTGKNVMKKATLSKDKEKSWTRWLTEGPPGYGIVILICGLLTSVGAGKNFFKSGNAFEYLIHAYLVLYGIIIMMLEISVCILVVYKGFRRWIETYARFLGQIWGRGIFYIYVSTLLVFLDDLFSQIVGGILGIMGILALLIWFATYWKMRGLRRMVMRNNREKDPAKIRATFAQYDADKSGFIDRTELFQLSDALGYPLEGNQLQSAMDMLDADRNGKIDIDEFMVWWLGKIPDPDIKEEETKPEEMHQLKENEEKHEEP